MPVINRAEYNNATAKVGSSGGIEQMEPGIYELSIQAIRLNWTKKDGTVTDGLSKQCVKVVYDVASGPFAQKYSDAYFMDWNTQPKEDMDFMHSCFLSWKNLDYFKGRIEALNADNPGFDALAAFEADRWDLFIGKKFWAVVDGTVTLNDNGYDRWTYDVGAWLTPQQAASGEYKANVTDNRVRGGSQLPPVDAYGDIAGL